MRIQLRTVSTVVFALALSLAVTGCAKKPVAAAPKPVETPPPPPKELPPPPPPAVRIDTFAVEPTTITQGQTATLRWGTANATDIAIQPGIGTVVASGTRSVTPQNSTTYTITASGPGGRETRTATITVNLPPPPVKTVPVPTTAKIDGRTIIEREGRDIYFDYDSSDIRADARTTMQQNADMLKRIFAADPTFRVVLEGHCDERGSAEYNLGLGDRRSTSAKDYLVQLGVPADRVGSISYGKDKPQCQDANEDCYQKNRRAHLAAAQ